MTDLDRIRNRIRGELEEIIAYQGVSVARAIMESFSMLLELPEARAEMESFSMWLEWLEIREKGKAYANAN